MTLYIECNNHLKLSEIEIFKNTLKYIRVSEATLERISINIYIVED